MALKGDGHSTVSTKEELMRRLRERTKPTPTVTLEPDGSVAGDVRRHRDNEGRMRIAKLRSSLVAAQSEFQTQQTFARLGGYAKARFGRER